MEKMDVLLMKMSYSNLKTTKHLRVELRVIRTLKLIDRVVIELSRQLSILLRVIRVVTQICKQLPSILLQVEEIFLDQTTIHLQE